MLCLPIYLFINNNYAYNKHNYIYKGDIMYLTIIPTYQCNGNCTYCYIDKDNLSRKQELPWNDDLIHILNQFEGVSVFGGEPFLYKNFYNLIALKNVTMVNTNLYASNKEIDKALNLNPNLFFSVSYHGYSHFGRPLENDNFYKKIKLYHNNITKLKYVVFIKNYKNIIKDIEILKSLNLPIEYISYFDKDDVDFTKSLSSKERIELKNVLFTVFNKDFCLTNYGSSSIFTMRSGYKNNSHKNYIGPYNLEIYHDLQNIPKADCTNCYPLGGSRRVCDLCINFLEKNDNIEQGKERYINKLREFKQYLNI